MGLGQAALGFVSDTCRGFSKRCGGVQPQARGFNGVELTATDGHSRTSHSSVDSICRAERETLQGRWLR